MINWLKSIFSQPQPSGSPQTIRLFQTTDRTLSQGAITIVQEGWVVDSKEEQTICLFEVQEPQIEQCLVTYRAKLKTDGVVSFTRAWRIFLKGTEPSR